VFETNPCPPNPALPHQVAVSKAAASEFFVGKIKASGGTPPYTYGSRGTSTFLDAAGRPTDGSRLLADGHVRINKLTEQPWRLVVTVTDANGCTTTSTVHFVPASGGHGAPDYGSGSRSTTSRSRKPIKLGVLHATLQPGTRTVLKVKLNKVALKKLAQHSAVRAYLAGVSRQADAVTPFDTPVTLRIAHHNHR
jgi:hypothetical protein